MSCSRTERQFLRWICSRLPWEPCTTHPGTSRSSRSSEVWSSGPPAPSWLRGRWPAPPPAPTASSTRTSTAGPTWRSGRRPGAPHRRTIAATTTTTAARTPRTTATIPWTATCPTTARQTSRLGSRRGAQARSRGAVASTTTAAPPPAAPIARPTSEIGPRAGRRRRSSSAATTLMWDATSRTCTARSSSATPIWMLMLRSGTPDAGPGAVRRLATSARTALKPSCSCVASIQRTSDPPGMPGPSRSRPGAA
mmetsp:Transcript_115148/g.365870  ORF Transcript_115148/g.365870 Transcript_115148/m.365870 type:complete len:252 (-) Transcript_115148:2453-3208(-)